MEEDRNGKRCHIGLFINFEVIWCDIKKKDTKRKEVTLYIEMFIYQCSVFLESKFGNIIFFV